MGERGKSEVQLQIFVFAGPCRLSRQKSILARILGTGSSFPLFFAPYQIGKSCTRKFQVKRGKLSGSSLHVMCHHGFCTYLPKKISTFLHSPSSEIACDEKGQKITESSLT